MSTVESLSYNPSEARRKLRERLRRGLSVTDWQRQGARGSSTLSDESALSLLLDLRVTFKASEAAAREDYSRSHASPVPTFDDLARDGWIRTTWERVYLNSETADALQRVGNTAHWGAWLGALRRGSHQRGFAVGAKARLDPSLAVTISLLETAPDDVLHLDCPSPEWVLARLWERIAADPSPMARARIWVDLGDLLPFCVFAPSRAWEPALVQQFRDATLEVVRAEHNLLGWIELRARLVAHMSLAWGQPVAQVEARVPAIPDTLVERYLWLHSPELGHQDREIYEACADTWRLVNMVIQDVTAASISAAPHPVAEDMLELAKDRPELLGHLTHWLQQEPVLVAEFVLSPRFSALGCLLIANWRDGTQPAREELGGDDRSMRRIVLADAVGAMRYFLATRSLEPSEASAFFVWMHGQAGSSGLWSGRRQVDEQMLGVVRSEFANLDANILEALAHACVAMLQESRMQSYVIAAALDLLALGSLSETVEPAPFTGAYLTFIRGTEFLTTTGIGAESARALVRVALRLPSEQRREFFRPIDVRALLSGEAKKENPYTFVDRIAKSLRAHVQVLCRALSAWDDSAPSDLLTALVASIRDGALANETRGRVDAFSVRFERTVSGGQPERSIAVDLGEALAAVTGSSQEELIEAILEIDEPVTLANLISVAPPLLGDRIRKRIDALTPERAGDVTSLTLVQARIEQLLSVGALDAAAKFLDVEEGLRTLGKVPGRELARLRMHLRLLLQRESFDELANAIVPKGLTQNESIEAQESIEFYKALGEFRRPNGDLAAAEATFIGLNARHPHADAYGVNVLAVRVSKLLKANLFGRLESVDVATARDALADADAAAARWVGSTNETLAMHACNRSLLLLATGRAQRAHDLLAGIRNSRPEDRLAAYLAVALHRTGRRSEALGTLQRAEQTFGATEVLVAARGHVLRGAPLDARATTASTEDKLQRVKATLFELKGMDASRQAGVFFDPPDALCRVMNEHVLIATARLVELVPMMRAIGLHKREDDISSVLRAVLDGSVQFIGWNVANQAPGGYSGRGTAGKRDLVVYKEGVTLAVLEAVACRRPVSQVWARKELSSHFQKLLGYSTCQLFFHLTYSCVGNPGLVVEELCKAAEAHAPDGFTFERVEPIPLTDSRPTGFIATYGSSVGPKIVTFLVLDMVQLAERGAARAAAKTNPRQPTRRVR